MVKRKKNNPNSTPTTTERIYAVALDAGRTITDTVIVDEMGRYYWGKALTNSQDESVSVLNSVRDPAKNTGA